MDNKKVSKHVPMHFGQFKDKKLEKEFINYEIGNSLKYIKPILLALGILYLSFSIADCFLIKNHRVLGILVVNRMVIFTLIVLLYFSIKHFKNYTAFIYWLTACEFLVSLSFLLNLYIYESPSFLIQSLGVIIIILAIFLVPNKWKNMISISVLISVNFFIFSLYYFEEIEVREFSASVVYIGLVVILSSISSHQMNYFKRAQYINEKELIKLSITDALTGIYNRLKFNEELEKWIHVSERYNTALSLAIFDIDNFKRINDEYGHLNGDRIIIETVKIVTDALRNTDIFARWGGDEFVILFPNTGNEQAASITERLRMLISEHEFEDVGKISCSFGMVSFMQNDNMETFLSKADQMLYMAKKEGKNGVKINAG